MKCHESKRHLDLFMDGELSVQENLKVLEHLNLCRPCAGVYEGEKALRAMLRARLGSAAAPAGLADRLLAEEAPAAVVAAPARVLRPRRWLAAAAAAGFAVAVLGLVFSAHGDSRAAFAYEMSSMHQKTHGGYCGVHGPDSVCVCPHCSSEPDTDACNFLREHLGHEIGMQNLKDLGYAVYGAQVWERQGHKIGWTVYHDAAGNSISCGLVPTKIANEPGPLLVCDGVERPVVMLPAGKDMTSVFVFDSETEAQRFRDARNLK